MPAISKTSFSAGIPLEVTSFSTVPIVNCEHDYPRADENDSREVNAGSLQIFGHDHLHN